MTAYLIVDVDITDADAYENYKAQVPALIAKHGGSYLVRGGSHEVFEGDWTPTRLVILQFPTMAAAHAFDNDPDYVPIKAIRHQAATSSIVAVQGLT